MIFRFIIVLILVFSPIGLSAQSCFISIFDKNGDYVNYKLNNRPKIEYHEDNMSIRTPNTIISYPLNRLGKYTITKMSEEIAFSDIELFDGMISSFRNEALISDCSICYSRLFSDTDWQPLYLPFELDMEEICEQFDIAALNNIRQYDDNEDGVFDRMEMEIRILKKEKIEANHPYLIRAKEMGLKVLDLSSRELFPTLTHSLDCSSTEMKFTFTGIYTTLYDGIDNDYYMLDNGIFKRCSFNDKMPQPFRWYMTIECRNNNNPYLINEIPIVEDNTSKISIHCNIDNNLQSIYDLNGIQHSNVEKEGVYLIKYSNGSIKKVILK